jgi:hypothetical protein
MGVDRFIGGNLLDYAYSRGAYPCAMRSQKFGEFNKGTKRYPRLAKRHTHTSDRVEHPGRYDNDMTRRGFNPRHRTVSGSINAFASHPPPEKRVVGVMHSHKLADMGRMTMRWQGLQL